MKHVVTLTISNPSHEHLALRRSQKTTNYIVEARDEAEAIFRASNHFRKLGNYVHEAKVAKPLTEETVSEDVEQVNEFLGVLGAAGRAAAATRAAATASKAISKAATASKAISKAASAPVRTLPAPVKTTPAPVRTMPAPAPVRTMPAPAPAPVRTMPAPAPVRTLPAPAPAPVRTMPAPAPAPVRTLPAPAPVRTVPARAPVRTTPSVPVKAPTTVVKPTSPVTRVTSPISPLVAAATVATGVNYLLNKPRVSTQVVEPEVEPELQPELQPVVKPPAPVRTLPAWAPAPVRTLPAPAPVRTTPSVPVKAPTTVQPVTAPTTPVTGPVGEEEPVVLPTDPVTSPVTGPVVVSPVGGPPATGTRPVPPAGLPDWSLSGGLEDSGFLRWIRAGRALSARQEMHEESHTEDKGDARKNAVTRVLEKRMKTKKEEMRGDKNKINMEPTLRTRGGMHNVKV